MEKLEANARKTEIAYIKEIEHLLPTDWREKARELKAIQRQRKISSPDELLNLNLLYVSIGGSYQSTCALMSLGAQIKIDKNAVYKRIQASGAWLSYLAKSVCEKTGLLVPKPKFLGEHEVIVVDASELPVPGSKGGAYRLHYALTLFNFGCRDMRVSDISEGEKLSLHQIKAGDIVEGDRIYGTIKGMEFVRSQGADFILRLRHNAFKIYDEAGTPLELLSYMAGMKALELRELNCYYRIQNELKPVRIIIQKNTKTAIERAQKRLHRKASKKQEKPASPQAVMMNECLVLATSLDDSPAQIVELYRARWQIEMVFLRLKELFGIGDIPSRNAASAMAWFNGKLLLAALCEAQLFKGSFPPKDTNVSESQYLE